MFCIQPGNPWKNKNTGGFHAGISIDLRLSRILDTDLCRVCRNGVLICNQKIFWNTRLSLNLIDSWLFKINRWKIPFYRQVPVSSIRTIGSRGDRTEFFCDFFFFTSGFCRNCGNIEYRAKFVICIRSSARTVLNSQTIQINRTTTPSIDRIPYRIVFRRSCMFFIPFGFLYASRIPLFPLTGNEINTW